jgi:RNA polymerase sigma factor (sigma-70 family)
VDAISLRSATESSDEALIFACRSGDRDAVDLLYRRHHDAALRFARRLMGNAADADDVAHEAFTKVMSAIGRGNGPDAVFRPYLFRTVRTVAADYWEQQAKETPSEETPDTAVHDFGLEAVLSQDSITPVYRAFESLPARWRTVLWHAEVENEPPRRIAPLLGIEPNAVSALLMRARRGLREAYLHQYAAAELPRSDCQPTLPFLAGTVLGTASARDRNAAKEHIRTCEDCRKVLADLSNIKKTMRVLVAPVLLSPSLASAATPSFPRWNPGPQLGTGILTASVIAGIAAAVGLVLILQTAGTPTNQTIAAQVSTTASPETPAGVPGTASRSEPSSAPPSQPTIESSPAGAPTTTDPGRTKPHTVPFLRPANPPRPLLAPPGIPSKPLAPTPVAPNPIPSATTTTSPSPSPSKPASSHAATATPGPTSATPTATPSASSRAAAPSTTPATPPPAPPACVPVFIWCLPV